MSDSEPLGDRGTPAQQPLALTVGCEFGLQSSQPAVAIMQVAPRPEPGIAISSENWYTSAEHHGYIDRFGNRCERFQLDSGGSHITYQAQLVLAHPADVIEPDASETPVGLAARRGPQLRDAEPLLPARRARPRGVAAIRRSARPAGDGCRRSSTTSTATSSSSPAPPIPGPPPPTPTAPGRASVATSRTWRSRSAAR